MLEYPVSIHHSNLNELVVISGGQIKVYPDMVYPMTKFAVSKVQGAGKHFKNLRSEDIYLTKVEVRHIEYQSFANETYPKDDPILNICKNTPALYHELVMGDVPYPMFYDIETRSTEDHFPDSATDDIISIQIKFPDSDPIILLQETDTDDKDILEKFGDYIIKSPSGKSPDFIVGYFHTRFDNPYVMGRLRVNGIEESWKARIMKGRYPGLKGNTLFPPKWMIVENPNVTKKKKKKARREEIYELIPGLYSIDLYNYAEFDMSLKNLPNKRMKTVAAFFNCPFIFDISNEEKANMGLLMIEDHERFMKYATSDVLITEFLYNLYEPGMIAASTLLKVPLTLASRMSTGQKAYIHMYRKLLANGYFSNETNQNRNADLYQKAEKYQGARVECKKRGYFPRIVYLDATAMYPNILHDFNLSYESMTYHGYIDYADWDNGVREGKIEKKSNQTEEQIPDIIEEEIDSEETDPIETTWDSEHEICVETINDKITRVYIPDNNYGCFLKFECNFTDSGYIREMINENSRVRKEYQKKSALALERFKVTEDMNDKRMSIMYSSLEQEQKRINNSIYGLLGNKYYEIGDLPIAVFVTAIGRWLMNNMVDYFGDAVIEIDTDGLILDRNLLATEDVTEINNYLKEKIQTVFRIPADKINFDLKFENNGSVYIHKMKNYIFAKEGETDPAKIKKKGSAFVGYDKAPVVLRASDVMSQCVLKIGPYGNLSFEEASAICNDIENLPMDMFKISKTIRKDISEYKGGESIYSLLERIPDKERTNIKYMKKTIIDWLGDNDNNGIKARYRNLIRTAKGLGSINTVIDLIAEDNNMGGTPYYMVNLLNRRISQGKGAKVDDVIEFYIARSSAKYLTIEEITDKSDLNIDKYRDLINRVIECFRYADTGMIERNVF